MITRIEEISMNSWPALQTFLFDGWILRFADGVTRRSNSVNPIYSSTLPTEEKIEVCEKLYSSRNLKTMFKLTERVFPENLDKMLENRGYQIDAITSVQTFDLNQLVYEPVNSVSISEELNGEWLGNYLCFAGIDDRLKPTYEKIIRQIQTKKNCLTVFLKKKAVGCGLGVLAGEYLGIFDITVSPEYRGWGFGRLAVEGILGWGRENGAETAYLQVILNNTTAMKLYMKMGFREIYKYWFRIKDNRG